MIRAAFLPAAPCGVSLFPVGTRMPQTHGLYRTVVPIAPPRQRRSRMTSALSPLALAVAQVEEAATSAANVASEAITTAGSAASDVAGAVQDELEYGSLRPDGDIVPVLATIIFFLFVYITIGAVIITWDEWRKNRNEERETAEFLATRGRKTAGVVRDKTGSLNRGSRRLEKKRRKQDERDKKRLNK